MLLPKYNDKMNKNKKNKKAQTTLEACLLIILFVAAGLTMYEYLRKAIQGNWRQNTDSFSDEQYDDSISSETDSGLRFISPTVSADLNLDDTIEQNFNLGSGSGILQVGGWGTYYDSAEAED